MTWMSPKEGIFTRRKGLNGKEKEKIKVVKIFSLMSADTPYSPFVTKEGYTFMHLEDSYLLHVYK